MVGGVRVEPGHSSSGRLSLHHDLQEDEKEYFFNSRANTLVSPRLKSQRPTFEHISCKLVAMFLAGESQRKT